MKRRSRAQILVASSLPLLAVMVACSREKAETQRLITGVTESYQQLRPKLAALQGTLAKLRTDVEDLAVAVPTGGGELRARYFTTEEIVGVLDGKMKWLSGEIEAAKQSLKKDQAIAVRDALAGAGRELTEASQAAVELVHESGRLQRVAALLKTPDRFSAYQKELATGFRIQGADDGVEAGLLGFIEDPGRKVDQTTWFDFDRVFFVGDSPDLDVRSSRIQLDNVAQILRASPSVKLEIAAFTDDSRAPLADQKRSSARARAVAHALEQMGVSTARLRTAGFGARHARCPANDTEDCRARNRRVALRVTAK